MARIDPNIYGFDSTPEGLSGAIQQLRQDFDAHTHDGSSSRSFETLIVETIRARAFSIRKTSYTDDTAGIWIGLKDGLSKLYVGTASNFMKWDGSSLLLSGTISGGSININNKFTVSSSGDVVMKSYSLISQYTSGEALTIGDYLCFKNKNAVWGDYASADRNTTAILSALTYVDSSNPTTASGAAVDSKLGITGAGGVYWVYGKLDLSGNPPGLPAWNECDRVTLRVWLSNAATNAQTPYISRLTSAFTEATVTYNTRPTDDGVRWAVGQTATAIAGESMASGPNLTSSGYIEFDITDLYRLWSLGTYTNNGFVIKTTGVGGDGNTSIGARNRLGGGNFNQAPYLTSIITVDNPGAGNTIVANDGKVYKASSSDYYRVKQLAGICGATVVASATVDVYSLADRSLIPSSVLSVNNNKTYYLTGSGTIGNLTNNIIGTGVWNLRVGTGTPNGLSVDIDKRPVFIRSLSDTKTSAHDVRFVPPQDATMAVVKYSISYSAGSGLEAGELILYKDRVTALTANGHYSTDSAEIDVTWDSGTTGTLNIVTGASGLTSSSFTIYWYK